MLSFVVLNFSGQFKQLPLVSWC